MPDVDLSYMPENIRLVFEQLETSGTIKNFVLVGGTALPFNLMSHSFRLQKANVCPVNIIASLKMAAIAQRNTMRDYYDLYWISKYIMPLIEIIKQTKHLIPGPAPIAYTETMIYTKDIAEEGLQNHLEPKEDISREQIVEYFVNELKRIKNRII